MNTRGRDLKLLLSFTNKKNVRCSYSARDGDDGHKYSAKYLYYKTDDERAHGVWWRTYRQVSIAVGQLNEVSKAF